MSLFLTDAVCGSLKLGVTNPKELLNNGRETVLEESITSASGLRKNGFITKLGRFEPGLGLGQGSEYISDSPALIDIPRG